MSLLTDALRLREGRRPGRGTSGPSFPPFRGPQPGRWVLAVLVICVLAVLGWWRGGWMVEKIEQWAGVAPVQSAPNLLASAPREKPSGGQTAREMENSGSKPEVPAAQEVPAVAREKTAPAPAAPVSAAGAEISAEGKQRGEILLADTLVKAAAEKAAAPAVPRMEPEAVAAQPAVAEIPAGGLQPMKVELAEVELIVETPEEREKKRIEAVEEFLRVLKVQGVRLQGAESRILVDGAPIGLGEKVGGLGLVLQSVEPQKIIFSDASGKKYPKSY